MGSDDLASVGPAERTPALEGVAAGEFHQPAMSLAQPAPEGGSQSRPFSSSSYSSSSPSYGSAPVSEQLRQYGALHQPGPSGAVANEESPPLTFAIATLNDIFILA